MKCFLFIAKEANITQKKNYTIFDIVRQGTQCGNVEIELQNAKMYCFILENRRKDMK